jgi:hypothetical protein
MGRVNRYLIKVSDGENNIGDYTTEGTNEEQAKINYQLLIGELGIEPGALALGVVIVPSGGSLGITPAQKKRLEKLRDSNPVE